MVESFNFAKVKKQMSIEQRRGIITLKPKKKKDPLYLDTELEAIIPLKC